MHTIKTTNTKNVGKIYPIKSRRFQEIYNRKTEKRERKPLTDMFFYDGKLKPDMVILVRVLSKEDDYITEVYKNRDEFLKSSIFHRDVVIYGDIIFDLPNRCAEIGYLKGDRKIRNIDKNPEELKELGKNITTSLMILYCIIRSINDNNDFKLKENFNEYQKYIDEYTTQTGFKFNGSLVDRKTYVSKIRKILESTSSRHEIARGKHTRIFS